MTCKVEYNLANNVSGNKFLYNTTINALQDPLHVINDKFQIILFNEAFQKKIIEFGFKGDFYGRSLFKSFPFLTTTIQKEYEEVSKTGKPLITEEKLEVGDKIIWSDVRKFPIFDENGKVYRILTMVRDITEQKMLEESLKEERNLFAAGPVVIVKWRNSDGWPAEYVSPNIESQFGYKPEDLISERVRYIDIIHPDEVSRITDEVAKYTASGTHWYEQEYRIKDSTGKYRWVMDFTRVIQDNEGKVTHYHGYIQDITEKREAQESLRRSEEKFRSLVETSNDWIVEVDTDRRYTYVSPHVRDVLGYEPKELTGKRYSDIMTSEEAQRADKIFYETAIKKEAFRRIENICFHKDGTPVVIETNGTPFFDENGNLLGYRGINRDISERKKAEKEIRDSEIRYRTLFEGADDGIFILKENRFVECNKKILTLFDCKKEDITGKTPWDFSPPLQPDGENSKEKGLKKINSALSGASQFFEWTHCRPDGVLFITEISLHRIVFSEEVLLQAIVRDITERKKAEEEKIELERQLLHARKLESLGLLAGGISHDFNNLLMAIIGNADIALSEISPLSPTGKRLIEIEKTSRRAAELCHQLLACSGKGQFIIIPLDLRELVREMSHVLEISISKKATLKYNFSEQLPAIKADPVQMRQIIMNLVINASDSLEGGSGVISVSAGTLYCNKKYLESSWIDEQLPEGDYVYLEVADTGCGMDKETLSKIFDPFFTTKFTGRGLGLAAVLGIVKSHRGNIKVDSKSGKGTEFKLIFPKVKDRPEKIEIEKPWDKISSAKGTILLVDDEKTILEVVKLALEKQGFNVLTAPDGEETIKVFQENLSSPGEKIICVILDLTMPRKNGKETFYELNLINSDIPVILSSGYNGEKIIERFKGKKPAAFIHKPYNIKTLFNKMQEILNLQKVEN